MLHANQVEELIERVCTMDVETLVHQFQNYRSTFPLDFTPEFLRSQSRDRLQHLFLAVCLQCQRMPMLEDIAEPAAA